MLIKLCSVLSSAGCMSLMFNRCFSLGILCTDSHSIKHVCSLYVVFEYDWLNMRSSKIRKSFIFATSAWPFIPHYIFAWLSSGIFHYSIQSVCSSACLPLPKPFACTHTHTLTSFFFSIGDEIWRSHRRGSLRPLIPNISLLCLNLIQVVAGWQRGNFLRDWADARDALRWYSFQVSPQQPIRSYIYYSQQARQGDES